MWKKSLFPALSKPTAVLPALACALLLTSSSTGWSQPLNFYTLAGYAGRGSANGISSSVQFKAPQAIAIDISNNVFVADTENHVIRKISCTGIITTLAGSLGTHGSRDGSGTNALFFRPAGIAVDASGNVLVADTGNNTVRKITATGDVTTFAGSAGNYGSTDNLGTNALFYRPTGIAIDNFNNIFVADTGNNTIRKITPSGNVNTMAGSAGVYGNLDNSGANALFSGPQGLTVDSSGNLYVVDTGNGTIRKITSSGVVTTFAGSAGNYGATNGIGANALFYAPQGITIDLFGCVYVADTGNHTIRKITSDGTVTTLAGLAGNYGSADSVNSSASFWNPQGITSDATGNLYIADTGNNTIRTITPGGSVTTFAGLPSIGSADGLSSDARFRFPQAVAVDAATNVYVADTANQTIRKISPSGLVCTLAGSIGHPGSVNNIGTNALFSGPQGITVDGVGNIYVADTLNHIIRRITPDGAATTFAGSAGVSGTANGTNTDAQFYAPQGLAVDGTGNVFVADTFNNLIRKITPGGAVTTLAGNFENFGSSDGTNSNARFYWPSGVAVDNAGNVFVADYMNHTIRELIPSGTNWIVNTVAGLAGFWGSIDGTNTSARFFQPRSLSVDASGALYVADSGNHAIRKITPSGTNWVVTTVAGLAGAAGSVDGTGINAEFSHPAGISLTSAGIVYVADSDNNTIRFDGSVPSTLINNLVVIPQFTSALIKWDTLIPTTSQIMYGPTPAYANLSSLNSTLRTNHSFLVTGLTTNTLYYFQAVCSSTTNQFFAVGSFSTLDNEIIVQSHDASYSGNWLTNSGAQDEYGYSYRYASTTTGADTAEAFFTPAISVPGYYDIYIWYSAASNRSTNAQFLASSPNGTLLTKVNQASNGGGWRLLAAGQYCASGTNNFVRIGNGTGETGRLVIADAVRWVYRPNQDSPANGTVPAWWSAFYFGTNGVNGSALAANGRTFFEDYLIGIAPNDPDTHLEFNISPMNPGFLVTFSPWEGGRTYQLASATNLSNPVWTVLPALPVTQNTYGEGLITYTNHSGSHTFYRLTVSPSP